MSEAPLPTLSLVDMVLPDQCNHHGTLFGGAALAMLDKLAFILGSRVLRGPLVTAAVRELQFHQPAPAGWLTECIGRVSRVGRRSVTLETQLHAENLLSGQRIACLTGQFVMVSPTPARAEADWPPLQPDSVCVAEIVFPGHANHRGILHGGPAMAWLAKAGFAAATRHARHPVVMAGSKALDFQAPAYVGEVVEITARIVRVGRSSMTATARMEAYSPTSGQRRCCTEAQLVFVAIDEDGRPVPVRTAASAI